MTAAVGRWRATYTPGNWIVLAGPTSVVVLEPPTQQWASLVSTLWDEVVGSASLVELAAQLALYRIDRMPSFAALFWTQDGMRSLVRGAVQLYDPDGGSVVATGEGIQTWTEVGLGALSQVRVEMPTATPDPAGPSLSLPLVVGVVRASSVLLDVSEQAVVFSPQGEDHPEEGSDEAHEPAEPEVEPAGEEAAEEEAAEEEPAEVELEGPTTELMSEPFPDGESTGADAAVEPAAEDEPPADDPDLATAAVMPAPPAPEPPAPEPPAPGPFDSMENGDTQLMMDPVLSEPAPPGLGSTDPDAMVMAVVCPYGHSSPENATVCRVCGQPIVSQAPRLVERPTLALLRASDGTTVQVDRAVLLGRAPSANLSTTRTPRLMTVPSPGHDISRTHVEVAPEGWQIVVTDLRSTNGTIVVRPGSGERSHLPPGEPVAVPLQSLLELGDGVSVLIDFPQ